MSTDKNGREYLKLDECKEGMRIELDEGFNCVSSPIRFLKLNDDQWYFSCEHGRHYINGNLEPEGYFIGVYKL